MPDDPKPQHPPIPIPEELIREAEELRDRLSFRAQFMIETLRFWADPDQRPTCGIILPPLGTPSDALESAEEMVGRLRDAWAALDVGAPTTEQAKQARLLRLVNEAGNLCLPSTEPIETLDLETGVREVSYHSPLSPEDAVAFVLGYLRPLEFTTRECEIIRSPRGVAMLVESVAARLGQQSGKDSDGKGPRWLEALYPLAVDLGLVGHTQDPKSWSDTLRNRGLIKKRKPPSSRIKTRAKKKGVP